MFLECTDHASTSLDRKFSIFGLTGDRAFRLNVESVFNADVTIYGAVDHGFIRVDIPLNHAVFVNDQLFGFKVAFHCAVDLEFSAFADLAFYFDTFSD